jgi:hypothetical protein
MTFSSASVSDREVDEVAATAAGAGGLRAVGGGKAACWRVAGAIAGAAAGAAAVTGAAFPAAVLAAGAVLLTEAWGTTLRAIGRGLGNGTFGLAQASTVHADNPTDSTRLVTKAVDRKAFDPKAVDRSAAARLSEFTAFLRGESFRGCSPSSI